jgi:tRNA pseudouridine32 synthase / 23S rRNA pseudouridine746 synthase
MVLNKPAGVLTVAGKDKTNHAFAQAVYESRKSDIELSNADRMVVHRLGMDTSGLTVMAKTLDAVRGLHTAFRTRTVERTYEALVCGHLPQSQGQIELPLMRDYEHPLYMRISTDAHQEALVDLDPEIVGKKILEQPKESITEFKVIAREELNGQPVTRVLLRSVSGRMHQLNCHLAAWGHPIVGDTAYGVDGIAAPNGGLTDDELEYLIPEVPSAQRATAEQQRRANAAVQSAACHAKTLSFRHPVTNQQISLQSAAPF